MEGFTVFEVFKIVVLVTSLLLGVASNVFIFHIFSKSRNKRRRRFEQLLCLLAVVDFLSMLLVPASMLYLTMTKSERWHLATLGCKIIPCLLQISCGVSEGILILLSYERYRALVKPYNNADEASGGKYSTAFLVKWLLGICALSLIIVAPYMSTLNVRVNFKGRTCMPDGRQHIMLMSSALVHLLRDIFAYAFVEIFRYRVKQACKDKSLWKRRAQTQRGRRILFALMMTFFVLVLPAQVFQFIFYMYVNISQSRLKSRAYNVLVVTNTYLNLLQMLKAVVNVFVYLSLHKMFRLRRGKTKHVRRMATKDENNNKLLISMDQNKPNNNPKRKRRLTDAQSI